MVTEEAPLPYSARCCGQMSHSRKGSFATTGNTTNASPTTPARIRITGFAPVIVRMPSFGHAVSSGHPTPAAPPTNSPVERSILTRICSRRRRKLSRNDASRPRRPSCLVLRPDRHAGRGPHVPRMTQLPRIFPIFGVFDREARPIRQRNPMSLPWIRSYRPVQNQMLG